MRKVVCMEIVNSAWKAQSAPRRFSPCTSMQCQCAEPASQARARARATFRVTRARGMFCLSSQPHSSTAPGATAISAKACARGGPSRFPGNSCFKSQAAVFVELSSHLVFDLGYYLVPTHAPVVWPRIDFCQDVCPIRHSYALPAAPHTLSQGSRPSGKLGLQHAPHKLEVYDRNGQCAVHVCKEQPVSSTEHASARGICDRLSK